MDEIEIKEKIKNGDYDVYRYEQGNFCFDFARDFARMRAKGRKDGLEIKLEGLNAEGEYVISIEKSYYILDYSGYSSEFWLKIEESEDTELAEIAEIGDGEYIFTPNI
jgi:hypothetical protein